MASATIKGESLQALGLELKTVGGLPQHIKDAAASVKEMDLSFNDISSLEGLSIYSNLEKLILDNNSLTSLASLPPMGKLKTLWLNKNAVDNQEQMFAVLASRCPGLTYLSLLFNPCCPNALIGHADPEYRRFRVYAKYRLPSLVNLDSTPITAEEAVEALKRGQFYKSTDGASLAQSQSTTIDVAGTGGAASAASGAAAAAGGESGGNSGAIGGGKKSAADLFDDLEREITGQRGNGEMFSVPIFSTQRHVYTGKSSEGNRFIGNSQL